jgi:hypothetical protein
MAPPKKHRLESVKIPIELNEEFLEARDALGHTHTQAVEEAIALYVKKRATPRPTRPKKKG